MVLKVQDLAAADRLPLETILHETLPTLPEPVALPSADLVGLEDLWICWRKNLDTGLYSCTQVLAASAPEVAGCAASLQAFAARRGCRIGFTPALLLQA